MCTSSSVAGAWQQHFRRCFFHHMLCICSSAAGARRFRCSHSPYTCSTCRCWHQSYGLERDVGCLAAFPHLLRVHVHQAFFACLQWQTLCYSCSLHAAVAAPRSRATVCAVACVCCSSLATRWPCRAVFSEHGSASASYMLSLSISGFTHR